MEPLLKVINLSKSFGTLPVVQQVSFDINPGEVIGLTGSIGSGKSVLAMLIAGLYEPDGGNILFSGKTLVWPFAAHKRGISVIHQKPALDDNLDVISNIFLGNEIGRPGWLGPLRRLNFQRMYSEAKLILVQLGMDARSLNERVSNLSGEQRQMLAIARTLTDHPKLVIIDEPTVLLSYANQQRLLGLIQNWRQQGVAVIFQQQQPGPYFYYYGQNHHP